MEIFNQNHEEQKTELSYGNITLKTSASGGFQGDIIMMGISNPQKYEKLLKENF